MSVDNAEDSNSTDNDNKTNNSELYMWIGLEK